MGSNTAGGATAVTHAPERPVRSKEEIARILGLRPLPDTYFEEFDDVANYISVPTSRTGGREVSASELALPVDLDEVREVLLRHGVTHAWLFGSRARGDHRPDSDVDILVYRESGFMSGEKTRLKSDLEQLCKVEVDLNDSLMKRFVPYIYPDLVKLA